MVGWGQGKGNKHRVRGGSDEPHYDEAMSKGKSEGRRQVTVAEIGLQRFLMNERYLADAHGTGLKYHSFELDKRVLVDVRAVKDFDASSNCCLDHDRPSQTL